MYYLGTQCIQFDLIYTELINLTKNNPFGPYNTTRISGSFTLIPNNSYEKSYIYRPWDRWRDGKEAKGGCSLRRPSKSMLSKQPRMTKKLSDKKKTLILHVSFIDNPGKTHFFCNVLTGETTLPAEFKLYKLSEAQTFYCILSIICAINCAP